MTSKKTIIEPEIGNGMNKADQAIFAEVLNESLPSRERLTKLFRMPIPAWNYFASYSMPPNWSCVLEGETFAGSISFAGRVIPSGLLFRNCTFQSFATFSGCRFLGTADFSGCQFFRDTSFRAIAFPSDALFTGCKFEEAAIFEDASFDGGCEFSDVTFSRTVLFRRAHFRAGHFFKFLGTTFKGGAWFEDAVFEKHVAFHSATFEQEALFDSVQFGGTVGFKNTRFLGSPTRFISIQSSIRMIFEDAVFQCIPEFFGAKCFDVRFSSNVEQQFLACLDSPPKGWTSIFYDNAQHSFRALRAVMSGNASQDQEQIFFRLELRARELRETTEINQQVGGSSLKGRWFRRLKLFGLKAWDGSYRMLSNYGFSIWRPIGWWFALLASLIIGCALVSWFTASQPHWSWAMASKITLGAIAHLWPLGGMGQFEVFIRDVAHADAAHPNEFWVLLLGISLLVFKLFSAILIFLVGLAIRNRFRIK